VSAAASPRLAFTAACAAPCPACFVARLQAF
jgi:hypothetical protein